jgi:hypothetical protein
LPFEIITSLSVPTSLPYSHSLLPLSVFSFTTLFLFLLYTYLHVLLCVLLPLELSDWVMKPSSHIHLVQTLKNTWSYTSNPAYVFKALCLIKHRDNLTLVISCLYFCSLVSVKTRTGAHPPSYPMCNRACFLGDQSLKLNTHLHVLPKSRIHLLTCLYLLVFN